jgi:predicted DNA binding CopG/RHH family protein
MPANCSKRKLTDREYYNTHNLLDEILEGDVDLSLDEQLRQEILGRRRIRRLKNVTIKMDPLYRQSIRKIATSKGIPYQTLVRQWLAEKVKKELKLA